MTRRLETLWKKALYSIEIRQAANHATGVTQNIHILLQVDPALREVTNTLVAESAGGEAAFQKVTDWLQGMAPGSLSREQADLASAWLRKVVAVNHMRSGRRWCGERDFAMYMLDTSFIDQPDKAWTTIEEFLQVVDVDGQIARERAARSYADSVLRVFFVPSGEYILASADYVMETIRAQIDNNVTACISRHDLAVARQPELVGDGFCVAGRLVCEIEKPSWRFTTSTDGGRIRAFVERVRCVAEAEYSVVVRQTSLDELEELLLEVAVLE